CDGGRRAARGARRRRGREAGRALRQRYLAGLVAWNVPEGGCYIWLALDKPVPLRTLFRTAHKARLLLNTGDLYDRGDSRHLRLSYVYASPAELETGLPILAGLIRKLQRPGS
ncbi:GntR family transcriptional regulator, partial [Paenibacillus riograndensis]